MYELTTQEGMLLALGIVSVATLLLLGVFVRFPRATRVVSAVVVCPTIGCPARAELTRDEWTLRFIDVTRCSVLGHVSVGLCNKACLRTPTIRLQDRPSLT